jgi:hypothetical protein
MNFINGLYTLVAGAINKFQAANPAAGIPNGTQITADWLNDVQGENLNTMSAAGISPAYNTPTQVLQALKRIFGGNRTLISAAGTTVLTADNAGLVVVNAAGGNMVLNLPLNSSAGGAPLEFVFIRIDTSSNTVTVVDAGSDTDAPGGGTSLPVIAGTPLWLHGDGASVYNIVLASNSSTYLKAANNLSDVASLATALTNLGFASDSASWFKIPNPNNPAKPWIVQFGSQTLAAANTSYTFSFPVTFPNAVLTFATTAPSTTTPTPNALGSVLSTSQYSMTHGTSGGIQYWLAIGN